ncbi:MAG: helix-turn-helix transcriptional regulator [Cyanobacteria bacterium P01_G01_bin.54]
MATRWELKRWVDWLKPGSPDDSRLFHADPTDLISVVPAHLGEGYVQEIPLQDNLSLAILRYKLTRDLLLDFPNGQPHIEYEFLLGGPFAGNSLFVPEPGFKRLGIKLARKDVFKVELILTQSTLIPYIQTYVEHLSSRGKAVVEQLAQAMCQTSFSQPNPRIEQLLQRGFIPEPDLTFEYAVSQELYAKTFLLSYENLVPMTPAMQQVVGQILSCPYQGKIRRLYLLRKALKLIALRLAAMVQTPLSPAELDSVYQAATILSNQCANPPSIEVLARQAYTNRSKLNENFRKVFNTTPYGFLRDFRLWQARRLLITSDRSIAEVAATVGYNNRSYFATAFRQQMGINPKTFQLQCQNWQLASVPDWHLAS